MNPVISRPERIVEKPLEAEKLTSGPKHHFFGYFDKYQEDISGRYALAHEVDFIGRQPEASDKAGIGMIDLKDGNKFIKLTETRTFCWQQGAMLQWLPGSKSEIIFNDRDGDKFVSRIMDINSGKERLLSRPVYCISGDGHYALSLNFSRLDKQRPGYGYAGIPDPFENCDHSGDDGIYLLDIRKDTYKLVVSLDSIVNVEHLPSMENYKSWFNHLLFSPDGKRFSFFHRWRQPDGWHLTRMYTASRDGSEIYLLNPEDMTSHYTWINNWQIICYANRYATGHSYFIFNDKSQSPEIIGKGLFDGDGHCSFSACGKWMLTDTYPDSKNFRDLILFDLENEIRYNIGHFHSVPEWPIPGRCDLHPRWSRDCKSVFLDSSHDGTRQTYKVDIRPLLFQK